MKNPMPLALAKKDKEWSPNNSSSDLEVQETLNAVEQLAALYQPSFGIKKNIKPLSDSPVSSAAPTKSAPAKSAPAKSLKSPGKVSKKTVQLVEDPVEDEQVANDGDDQKPGRANWKQRILLERIFLTNPYPNLQLRTELGKHLGMTPRKVQIWFQNRRTKQKTMVDEDGHELQILVQAVDEDTLNTKQKGTGNTLLNLGVAMDHSSVQSLLLKGADCNIPNINGWTPLYTAVAHNHKHLVELLLSRRYNCDVNAKEFVAGLAPLHLAALRGMEGITSTILSKALDLDINITDNENRTPLHHACIHGHTEIVKQLLNRKAIVNCKSKTGQTPLHCAALSNSSSNIADMLIRAGADINEPDNDGWTPLAVASRAGNVEVMRVLLHRGCNVNCLTNLKETPLHIASRYAQNTSILDVLFEYGVDFSWKNSSGQTAVDVVMESKKLSFKNHIEQRMLMLHAQASMNAPNHPFYNVMNFVQ